MTTPTGFAHHRAGKSAGSLTLETTDHLRRIVRSAVNALGVTLSHHVLEPAPAHGEWLTTGWTRCETDAFGRAVRREFLDGTFEELRELQWHGGPRVRRHRDGSASTMTYGPDGSLASVSRYGVTAELETRGEGAVHLTGCL